MTQTLADFAKKIPVLLDGATGTMLQELGLPVRQAPEVWVLENPTKVFLLAEAYVNAGSQIILTCTFGGTAIRLLNAGLDAQAYEINRKAAELAKQAAQARALVAGAMGPLGQMPLALGTLTYAAAVDQFADQARALVDGGVDLFYIESMSDLEETIAAIEGARRASSLPIFATMTFENERKTLLGITPTLVAHSLKNRGVAAIGANCGNGPEEMVPILREMRAVAPNAILIAKPNAGVPQIIDGKPVYPVSALQFAGYVQEWANAGAKIVGGCCGTTPKYIEMLRRVIG